jgi:meso-butanediol dehydrogenase/(S,S)-butanediol dehydrogenase/diacetyl reductase
MGLLEGKAAIVTGAGQGVGQGIAVALAREGASVVVAGRTLSKCERTAEQINAEGGVARALECDVRDLEQIERCVASTLDSFGRIDILVNNAQETGPGKLLEIDEAKIAAQWESGPLATLRFMRVCHPHLRESGGSSGGVVVNLGSQVGIAPNPGGYGVYGAVKEAIRSLSRAAACEWGPDGIRVYTLLPVAYSPAMRRAEERNPEHHAAFVNSIPLRRIGDPTDDIGPIVVFLCSDAAKYLTGISVTADGGSGHLG